MIEFTWGGGVLPYAPKMLRCEPVGEKCSAEFHPRERYWGCEDLRRAAAQESGWTQDEVRRDHCWRHRSVYAAKLLQDEAEATYPETHSGVDVTAPDGIPQVEDVTEVMPVPAEVTVPDVDDLRGELPAASTDRMVAPLPQDDAAGVEHTKLFAGDRGALTLSPRSTGKHRGEPKRNQKPAEEPRRQPRHERHESILFRLGLLARRPLDLPDDDAPVTDDPEEWLAPLQQGGTAARRKLTHEFARRGWLGKPRKPRSLTKRHQKAAVAETTQETEIAA